MSKPDFTIHYAIMAAVEQGKAKEIPITYDDNSLFVVTKEIADEVSGQDLPSHIFPVWVIEGLNYLGPMDFAIFEGMPQDDENNTWQVRLRGTDGKLHRVPLRDAYDNYGNLIADLDAIATQ